MSHSQKTGKEAAVNDGTAKAALERNFERSTNPTRSGSRGFGELNPPDTIEAAGTIHVSGKPGPQIRDKARLEEILSRPVSSLGLGGLLGEMKQEKLRSAGICSIGDLMMHGRIGLLCIRDIGRKSVDAIGKRLNELGLALPESSSKEKRQSIFSSACIDDLAKSIDDVITDSHSFRALENSGITRVYELAQMSDDEIERIHGIGWGRREMIKKDLSKLPVWCGVRLDEDTLDKVKGRISVLEALCGSTAIDCKTERAAETIQNTQHTSRLSDPAWNPEIIIEEKVTRIENASLEELSALAEKARKELNDVIGILRDGALEAAQRLVNAIIVKTQVPK